MKRKTRKKWKERKNREASKIRVPKRRTKPIALSLCYSYPYLPENTEAEEEEENVEKKRKQEKIKIQYQQNVLSKTNVKEEDEIFRSEELLLQNLF